MSKLEIVRHKTEHLLDRALVVLDKAVMMIPDDQLLFKPTRESMTAKQLASHIYQTVYVLTRSTSLGEFRLSHLGGIPFDLDKVTTAAHIVEYGASVKRYVGEAVADFREEDLERVVNAEWKMTGFDAMNTAFEESIHHRGQVQLYLRLMGLEPPYLYDYS